MCTIFRETVILHAISPSTNQKDQVLYQYQIAQLQWFIKHLIINMSHKQKLQNFRVQIRNKEINQILARKRLFRDYEQQNCNAIPQLQPLNSYLIMHIATISQFQENIEQLHRIGWPKELKKYLSAEFNYREQQIWASSALSNLLYLSEGQQPSPTFSQNILQILSGNSSRKVLTNVLTLLFNLAHDYKNWLDHLIQKQNLIQRLSLIFDFQQINHSLLSELMLTICKILKRASPSREFLKAIQPILNMVNSNAALDPLLLPPTLYCLCQLTQHFSKEISHRLVEIKFFKKMAGIIKVLTDPRILEYYVHLAINTLEQLTASNFQSQIFPIVCQKLQIAPRVLKLKIYRVIYYALQQNKLNIILFYQQPILPKILLEFQCADDLAILQQLSYIFCVCLLNLKLKSKQASSLVQALKRAKQLMYEKVESQGFIEETLIEYEKLTSI